MGAEVREVPFDYRLNDYLYIISENRRLIDHRRVEHSTRVKFGQLPTAVKMKLRVSNSISLHLLCLMMISVSWQFVVNFFMIMMIDSLSAVISTQSTPIWLRPWLAIGGICII